jgi:flavodoxin
MPFLKVLVVYYSRTGTTRRVALDVAKALGAEAGELTEARTRSGILGYLRSGFEASFARTTTLQDFQSRALGYDLVVVGTPVWNAHVCSPVRTFLRHHVGKLPKLAFFATMGGRGSQRAFRDMAQEAKREPIATLSLLARDVEAGKHLADVSAFERTLRNTAQAEPVARV